MKSALEQYTRQKSLFGENEQEILDKFLAYASLCSDPMNILNYMQEKSICIFLGNYWTYRANLFAEMGDFSNAYLCLKEAISRDHIVKQNDLDLNQQIETMRKIIIRGMKRRSPQNRKRTPEEYAIVYEQKDNSIETLEKLVKIANENYPSIKEDLAREFEAKREGLQPSWLSPLLAKKQQVMEKIEERIKSVTNQSMIVSMRTPITKRDPLRLTKTMNSIDMARKKRSTQVHKKPELEDSDDESESEDEKKMHTTPVGRQLSRLKSRVTFSIADYKIQNKRGAEQEKPQTEMLNSRSLRKRGSILKNKELINLELDEQDMV